MSFSTVASFSRTDANVFAPDPMASNHRSRSASTVASATRSSSSRPVVRAAARRNAPSTASASAARFLAFVASGGATPRKILDGGYTNPACRRADSERAQRRLYS
jgi:hypothetical protein